MVKHERGEFVSGYVMYDVVNSENYTSGQKYGSRFLFPGSGRGVRMSGLSHLSVPVVIHAPTVGDYKLLMWVSLNSRLRRDANRLQ